MIHPEEIIDFIVKNSESLYPSLGVYEYVFNNKNAVKFLNLLKQNGLECKNIEIFEKEKNVFKHAYGWFNTEMNDNEYLTDYLERNILLSIDYINNTNFTIKDEKLYFNIVWDYRIIEPEIIYKLNNNLKHMIDLNAPIIPFQEAGGIKLYTPASDMYEYISDWKVKRTARLGRDVLYEIGDDFSFNVNIYNGKICAITVGGNYKGLLWNKIGIGTHIDEVLKIDPSFEYEDFEEFYYNSKGIQIVTWADTHTIMSISIGIKENNWLSKDNINFEKGNW